MDIITKLPRGAMTLRPATDFDGEVATMVYPYWESEEDGRFVIVPVYVFEGGSVNYGSVLEERWNTVATVGGMCVQIRRADCGAGCRCAGEFRFPPED